MKPQRVHVYREYLTPSEDPTRPRVFVPFPMCEVGQGLVPGVLVPKGQGYREEMGRHFVLNEGAPEPFPVVEKP